MKKLQTCLLLLICVCSVAAQDLTVATFNIRNANDRDRKAGNGWEQRCPYVCSLIEFHGFDIFGAQEVLHSQLEDMLAGLPGYAYVGVGRDDGKTAGEYAPIFYRRDHFRLLDSGTFWLAEQTDKPNKGWDAALPRICSWVYLADLKHDRNIWFFNLHMDHVGVKARAESAKLVVEQIGEMCGGETVILTGDFNVDQHNDIYKTFTLSELLVDSYEAAIKHFAPTGTFNAFDVNLKTDSRIDHIFVSPSFSVLNYGVLTDTYRVEGDGGESIRKGDFPQEVSLRTCEARAISDHFPVVVKLDYGK